VTLLESRSALDLKFSHTVSQGGFGSGGGGRAGRQSHEPGYRSGHKGGDQSGHSAEVIAKVTAFVPSEEGAATHDMEVEDGGERGEPADGHCGSGGNGSADDAVRQPIEQLRQHGDSQNDGQAAQESGPELKGSLLETGVNASGKSHIEDLNHYYEKAAAGAGAYHGGQVDEGASGCA